MRKRMLSGMQPSGRLHLGNWLGALQNWTGLQSEYDSYFFVADWHALSTNYERTENIREYVREMLLDWLAVGIDPKKSTIFLQSGIPEHAVLYLLFSMITPVPWLERNPTYKEKQQELSDRDLTTYGFLGYPVLQAADILIYKAAVVPVGVDQLPHLELAREIARRFNHLYRKVFPEPKALMTPTPKILGYDRRKMSKSYENAIYLSDAQNQVERTVGKMITDEKKIKKGDPGRPEICNVFTYHGFFSTPDQIAEVERNCRSGALGCVDCKKTMAVQLNRRLEPIREKREDLARHPDRVEAILSEGTAKAGAVARETVGETQEAMKISGRKKP
jgi:tryptophanyl-tRNA synthetase